jgi:DNA modification methylase
MEINKIYNENGLHTMQRMPDNYIDLTITSPPYDNLRVYKGFKFPFKHIARQLYRVTKWGGVVVWVVADATINGSETGTSFSQALFFKEVGFRLHDTMIYGKENFIPLTHNRYEQAFEYMFIFSKGKPKTFNPIKIKTLSGGKSYNLKRKGYCTTIKEGAQRRREEVITTNDEKIKGNIFYYTLGGEKVNHPAPFQEDMAADHIQSWSNEGDLIYDCCGGSGTVAKIAHLSNRNWIMSEISSEYCQIANKRLQPYLNQLQLL